ncbi:MAG: hypothetical protein AAFX40_19295, partial [Cyanobacteria bacterium J06639_1]
MGNPKTGRMDCSVRSQTVTPSAKPLTTENPTTNRPYQLPNGDEDRPEVEGAGDRELGAIEGRESVLPLA